MAKRADSVGFQPRTTPSERRADLDNTRRLAELEAKVADLEARVSALEGP